MPGSMTQMFRTHRKGLPLASARSTLSRFGNAEVRKATAYDIGFEFSIGVIHHLAFPE